MMSIWAVNPMVWRVTVVVIALAVIGYVALVVWARSAPRPASLGVHDGRLAPLPPTPNAVSTQTDDADRRMKPWAFDGDTDTTRASIVAMLNNPPRITIVTDEAGYIHAEFRTRLVGYIDDVEFYLDEKTKLVHFRSASRLGRSDLGANRARMEGFGRFWNGHDGRDHHGAS